MSNCERAMGGIVYRFFEQEYECMQLHVRSAKSILALSDSNSDRADTVITKQK